MAQCDGCDELENEVERLREANRRAANLLARVRGGHPKEVHAALDHAVDILGTALAATEKPDAG